MSERRLDELEARYSELEHTVKELSEVLWRQQKDLDLLRELVRQLTQSLAVDPGLVDPTRTDRPPHY
jgi:uncharacterized coiled-coil protein SlyX